MSSLIDRPAAPGPGLATAAMPSPYRALLETAYELGAVDGGLARRLDLPEDPAAFGMRCRGRRPEEFAGWLWRDRPGSPPAGLLNAGAWYLQGFRDGLAAR